MVPWHSLTTTDDASRPSPGDELTTLTGFLDGGLDQVAARPWPDGRVPSLRWILVHLIEEYARHNGHADLIREAVDGETGE